ncbi:MAG: hypothetical protein HZA53_11590 [Planctomycetes bacterium]|nr:hypothetical protein [Planctomycetota bacterium]
MNSKLTFTPTQIQKFSKAFKTTRNTDWKIQTNSVTTIQAFRTLMSAFPGLIRDWNGFYATTMRATTKNARRNTSKRITKARKSTNQRSTTIARKNTRATNAKRWNTTSKRSTTRTGANTKRWNAKKNTTTRSTPWNTRRTITSKTRRAA